MEGHWHVGGRGSAAAREEARQAAQTGCRKCRHSRSSSDPTFHRNAGEMGTRARGGCRGLLDGSSGQSYSAHGSSAELRGPPGQHQKVDGLDNIGKSTADCYRKTSLGTGGTTWWLRLTGHNEVCSPRRKRTKTTAHARGLYRGVLQMSFPVSSSVLEALRHALGEAVASGRLFFFHRQMALSEPTPF